MPNLNDVTLIGRLTRDPELRQSSSSDNVFCMFTVAIDRPHQKDQEAVADFPSCVAWNQSARYLTDYGRKGQAVVVKGRIQTRSYEDRDGKKVYVTEVVARSVQLIYNGNDNQNNSQNQQSSYQTYQPVQPSQQEQPQQSQSGYDPYGIDPNEIPF